MPCFGMKLGNIITYAMPLKRGCAVTQGKPAFLARSLRSCLAASCFYQPWLAERIMRSGEADHAVDSFYQPWPVERIMQLSRHSQGHETVWCAVVRGQKISLHTVSPSHVWQSAGLWQNEVAIHLYSGLYDVFCIEIPRWR